eukprot:366301-Chlamydomonas_euryale.AAC.8
MTCERTTSKYAVCLLQSMQCGRCTLFRHNRRVHSPYALSMVTKIRMLWLECFISQHVVKAEPKALLQKNGNAFGTPHLMPTEEA